MDIAVVKNSCKQEHLSPWHTHRRKEGIRRGKNVRLCVCWFCSTPKQPNSFNKTVVYTHTLLSVILLQEKEPKKTAIYLLSAPCLWYQPCQHGIDGERQAQRSRQVCMKFAMKIWLIKDSNDEECSFIIYMHAFGRCFHTKRLVIKVNILEWIVGGHRVAVLAVVFCRDIQIYHLLL